MTSPQNLVLCLAFAAVLLAIAVGAGEHAPYPYVWRGVALVYLASALPLAGAVAELSCRRRGPVRSAIVAAFFAGIGAMLWRMIPQSAATGASSLSLLTQALLFRA